MATKRMTTLPLEMNKSNALHRVIFITLHYVLQVQGLCGNMNGNQEDDYTMAAGISSTLHDFAKSWMGANCPSIDYKGPLQPCMFSDSQAAKDLCHHVGGELCFIYYAFFQFTLCTSLPSCWYPMVYIFGSSTT